MEDLLRWVDPLAIAVFAASGALVASRKRLDPVGFILIAVVTGFGGGTVRDLLLGRTPVFWLNAPDLLAICAVVGIAAFFFAHRLESRFLALLWADAVGLALYAVVGAETALGTGSGPWAAVLLGTITATFGGILRDILCNELPLILRKEIYATAAAAGAALFVGMHQLGVGREAAMAAGALFAFAIRGASIVFGWSLPPYKAAAARDYPDDR